ncbi:MAG: substrate-binding domain-containing protein [Acidimicrobiia bacterium]|nr:substrate-binding domain-containing protein [Acidimicrobiia bacterium]
MKLIVVLALIGLAACGRTSERVVVGAGTTLVDSGFIEALAADFESTHPEIQLSVLGESSAQILNLGRSGAVDVLLTHAPDQEAVFLAEQNPQLSEIVISSEFLVVGPPDLVPTFAGLSTVEAFARISHNGYPFVSRGDGSGTHETELEQWPNGVAPVAEWYISTGQGMGLTLQVADQRDAFTLAEAGAFFGSENLDNLAQVELIDPPGNPYRITVTADAPPGAREFADWMLSEAGREAINRINQALFGAIVYAPNS